MHSSLSYELAPDAKPDTDKIEWSYGDEWSQGDEPNKLASQFDCLKIDQQSELEGPHQSFASDYYVELPISYGEETFLEIPISYDEESDCEVYNYCYTEGDCRPEMTYLGYSSDDMIAKSIKLNALDIVRQMYRTPSETSLNMTEKNEC